MFEKLREKFSRRCIGKCSFMLSFSFFIWGFSIMIIMIFAVYNPWNSIKTMIETSCHPNHTIYPYGPPTFSNMSCMRFTGKKRYFPCVQVWVKYEYNDSSHFAILHENEYVIYDYPQCSFQACEGDAGDNQAIIAKFVKRYGDQRYYYKCLHDPVRLDRVALGRTHSYQTILLALLVPGCFSLFGIIWLFVTYCTIGCDVWDLSSPATAQWTKSFSTLESEQAKRQARAAKAAKAKRTHAHAHSHGVGTPQSQRSAHTQV